MKKSHTPELKHIISGEVFQKDTNILQNGCIIKKICYGTIDPEKGMVLEASALEDGKWVKGLYAYVAGEGFVKE